MPAKNPRRVAAGRLNREKRGPLSEQGRQKLRETALAHRPWEHSTGPTTAEGKTKSAANGRKRQRGAKSSRQIRKEVLREVSLLGELARIRGDLERALQTGEGLLRG
jgi:hypothetical protein